MAHQAGLQTNVRIAHLTFKFGARDKGSNRIDDQNINRARTHQRVSDFKGLFTGIGLGNQEFVGIHTKLAGISRVKRVFGIDKRTGPAKLLGFGNRVQRQRGFTRTFRTIDFDDTATRQTANAQSDIKTERTG